MALSPDTVRRATAAAQTVLKESDPGLLPDGKPGSYTKKAYEAAPAEVRSAVDRLMAALGVPGSIPEANAAYRSIVDAAVAKPAAAGSKRAIFDLRVVPALTREARRLGLIPENHIAQIALESAWGESTPILPDGRPSYNYGGIKWNTIKTKEFVEKPTWEVVKGVRVRESAKWAVFENADDFAKQYFQYLMSSRRYRGLEKAKTAFEFGTILQAGQYASDPDYAQKLADVASSVRSRYALA